MYYTTLNQAFAAALVIALDRLQEHVNNVFVKMEAGDGAALTAHGAKSSVLIVIGSAASDMNNPYYTIDAVDFRAYPAAVF